MSSVDEIEIELTVQIGEAELPLKRLLRMGRGAFIPLGGDERKRLDVLANGRKIARGHVVLNGDEVTVQIDGRTSEAA